MDRWLLQCLSSVYVTFDSSGAGHMMHDLIDVCPQYLGIPLAAGVVTRFTMILSFGRPFFENKFLKYFSPLALIGLLYTIIVIFAEQAHQIIDNIGPVFRVFVPMILYFAVMWTGAFGAVYWWNQKRGGRGFGYEMAVVQAFTAGSNNFVSKEEGMAAKSR